MSEELIPDENNQPTYDFNFICRALNLIPYDAVHVEEDGSETSVNGAFNAGAICQLRFEEFGTYAVITLHGGNKITLREDQLADLEETIKRRTKELQEYQAEEIKRQAELRIQSELNAANQAMANAAMMGKLKGMKRTS